MNVKTKFLSFLKKTVSAILFLTAVEYLLAPVAFLQKIILLLNHKNSILFTISNKGFMAIESFSIFVLITLVATMGY